MWSLGSVEKLHQCKILGQQQINEVNKADQKMLLFIKKSKHVWSFNSFRSKSDQSLWKAFGNAATYALQPAQFRNAFWRHQTVVPCGGGGADADSCRSGVFVKCSKGRVERCTSALAVRFRITNRQCLVLQMELVFALQQISKCYYPPGCHGPNA